MSRPRESPAIRLAQKYNVEAKLIRKFWRKGMSELAIKCCINEAKRNKLVGQSLKTRKRDKQYWRKRYRAKKAGTWKPSRTWKLRPKEERVKPVRKIPTEQQMQEAAEIITSFPYHERSVTWLELSSGRSNS